MSEINETVRLLNDTLKQLPDFAKGSHAELVKGARIDGIITLTIFIVFTLFFGILTLILFKKFKESEEKYGYGIEEIGFSAFIASGIMLAALSFGLLFKIGTLVNQIFNTNYYLLYKLLNFGG